MKLIVKHIENLNINFLLFNKANVSFLDAHTKANQNINNLKFVYDLNNKSDKDNKSYTENILIKTYPRSNGVRNFIEIKDGNKE